MHTYSHYIEEASVYDSRLKELAGTIRAESVDKTLPDPARYEFYCTPCREEADHFCQLRKMPEDEVEGHPPRFHLLDSRISTHRCEHRLRYWKIDTLARRYNAAAVRGEKHGHVFRMDIPGLLGSASQAQNLRVIDRATRLAKITQAAIYDPAIMHSQFLEINGAKIPFHGALYDDARKTDLFVDAREKSLANEVFWAAAIFRPNAHKGYWKGYMEKRAIPGQRGADLKINDRLVRPSAVLVCKNDEVWRKANRIDQAIRAKQATAMMVFARAAVNENLVSARLREISANEDAPRPVHVCLNIEYPDQISAWTRETTFSDAIENQAGAPDLMPPLLAGMR